MPRPTSSTTSCNAELSETPQVDRVARDERTLRDAQLEPRGGHGALGQEAADVRGEILVQHVMAQSAE